MVLQYCAMSMWTNLLQLLAVAVVFVLVLIATYYTTRWIGKSGIVQKQSQNIKVFETFKISPNKYIQIVQLGSEYYAIGVTKDNIQFLTKLDKEQLDFESKSQPVPMNFKEILEKLAQKKKNK